MDRPPVSGEPPRDTIRAWLDDPDTRQLFANALSAWPPTAKPNEYVAIWRRTLADLLITEVLARMETDDDR